jgi:hypothetical protein
MFAPSEIARATDTGFRRYGGIGASIAFRRYREPITVLHHREPRSGVAIQGFRMASSAGPPRNDAVTGSIGGKG